MDKTTRLHLRPCRNSSPCELVGQRQPAAYILRRRLALASPANRHRRRTIRQRRKALAARRSKKDAYRHDTGATFSDAGVAAPKLQKLSCLLTGKRKNNGPLAAADIGRLRGGRLQKRFAGRLTPHTVKAPRPARPLRRLARPA